MSKYKTFHLNIGDTSSTGFVLIAHGESVPLKSLPIEVIERAALDEAVGLLKDLRINLYDAQVPAYAGKIDEFLRKVAG